MSIYVDNRESETMFKYYEAALQARDRRIKELEEELRTLKPKPDPNAHLGAVGE